MKNRQRQNYWICGISLGMAFLAGCQSVRPVEQQDEATLLPVLVQSDVGAEVDPIAEQETQEHIPAKEPSKETEKPKTKTKQINPYAQVAPEKLDPSLTSEDLERMYALLASIASGPLLNDDPNSAQVLQRLRETPCEVDARKAYLQARRLLTRGKAQDAVSVLEGALGCDPNGLDLMMLLARASYETNQMYRAEALSRELVRLGDDRLLSYSILGDAAMGHYEYKRAIGLYRRALEAQDATGGNPRTAMLHLDLASALMAEGYYQAALESYRTTYRLLDKQSRYSHDDPAIGHLTQQAHLVLIGMAGLYLQMGEIAQAVDLLDETLDVLGDVNLVELFIDSLAGQRIALQLRYHRVVAFCEYLLSIDYPGDETVAMFYRGCEKMSKLDDFPKKLSGWTKRARKFRPLLDQRDYAYGLALVGQFKKAEKELRSALADESEHALLYRELGRLYQQWQRWEEMLTAYSEFLNLADMAVVEAELEQIKTDLAQINQPDDLWQRWQEQSRDAQTFSRSFLLGHLAELAGRTEPAVNFYQDCVGQNNRFEPGVESLCELLLKSERYDDVIVLMEQLYDLAATGESPRTREPSELIGRIQKGRRLWYLGRAYGGLQHYRWAEQVYRHILLHYDGQLAQRVALLLGDVLIEQGAFAQAETILLKRLDQVRQDSAVFKKLLKLYGGWNAQVDLSVPLKEATAQQARKIFRQWLEVRAQVKSQAIRDWSVEIATLEELVHRFEPGRILRILLSELYAGQKRFAEALELLEPLVQDHGGDVEVLELMAEYHSRSGDYVRAAELYEKLWQLNPQDSTRFVKVLSGLRLAGESQKALILLQESRQEGRWQSPEAIRLLLDETALLFRLIRGYDEAVAWYRNWFELLVGEEQVREELITRAGDKLIWALGEAERFDEAGEKALWLAETYSVKNWVPVVRLVRQLNVRCRFEQSRDLLERLLAIDADELLLQHLYGKTLLLAGQGDQAIEHCRLWLAKQPQSELRRQLLVVLLKKQGDLSGAIEMVRQWRDEKDSEDLAYQHFHLLLAAQEYEKAEAMLQDSRPLNTKSAEYFEAKIQLLVVQKKCQRAMMTVNDIVRDPDQAKAYELKAKVLAACGQYDQAIAAIQTAIEKSSDPVDSQLSHSFYLEKSGKIDEAIEVLEELLRAYPNDSSIQNNLGYILANYSRDLQRSGELLAASYQTQPDSGPTLDSLGWLHYKRGEFETALVYLYQAAAALFEIDAEIWDHLGDTAYRLGRLELAKYYWQQVLGPLDMKEDEEEDSVKGLSGKKLEQLEAGGEVEVAPSVDREVPAEKDDIGN